MDPLMYYGTPMMATVMANGTSAGTGMCANDNILLFESYGGLAVWCLLTLYSFLAMAVVCDAYLVPALEILCERLQISEDVAGASFMAIGNSAPELVVNIISTVKGSEAVCLGVGSVMGSGMIAFCLIPGVCALCTPAGQYLELDWFPFMRDTIFFFAGVVYVMFAIRDGAVNLLESGVLVIIYTVYIIFLFAIQHRIYTPSKKEEASDEERLLPGGEAINTFKEPLDEEEEGGNSCCAILSMPIEFVYSWTVPDSSKRPAMFPLTLFCSMAWIWVFSYGIVWVIDRLMCWIPVSQAIMGMTLVALGAQVPDTIGSIAVARKGQGNMALANALGAQIVNVEPTIGVPYFISNLVGVEPKVTWGNDVFVVYGLCAMAAILVIVCSLSACFGPRAPGIALGRVAGGFLLMCYFVGLTGVVLCSQVFFKSPAA